MVLFAKPQRGRAGLLPRVGIPSSAEVAFDVAAAQGASPTRPCRRAIGSRKSQAVAIRSPLYIAGPLGSEIGQRCRGGKGAKRRAHAPLAIQKSRVGFAALSPPYARCISFTTSR